MRGRLWCLSLALVVTLACAGESPVDIEVADTQDLRLLYYDGLSYLEPHAVRTFTNSLAWQRRMFDWAPSERQTVWLRDFGDYGNAYADSTPHDRLMFDVAPLAHTFETFPASERMYSLMNHEMIHMAQGDVANDQDRRWRAFFLGKVAAQGSNPESLLYSYLTVPRYTAPRWWAEGSAVFFETWMSGGLGRAQGGYDEMVFRAMVRDDTHFYDPLGLASQGTKVDFQGMGNAYLYGTRFTTWLAYTYTPEKVVAWSRRGEGSKRYYADQFQQIFGTSLEKAWQDWIAFEHDFQRRNLTEVRQFPITPDHRLVANTLGSVSRMYYEEATGTLYAAVRYPGTLEHVAALNTRDGSMRRLADIKGGMYYRVTSFAYDAASGTAFFVNDNLVLQGGRSVVAVDVKTGQQRMLLRHVRIGDIVFNPADRSLLGVRHENGLATLVRIPYPYTRWFAVYTFPYEHVPTDLDISPDGRLLSATMSEDNGDQYLRVWELDKVLSGDLKPLSEFKFGQSVPEGFVFSRDGRYLYGSSYYTGVSNIFRYEVATGEVEAVSNAETGFFRPVPLADGRLVVLTYTGAGFVPTIIDPRPLKDVSAISFLGSEVAEKYPVVKTWQVAPPDAVDDEKLVTAKGPYMPLRSVGLASAYPVLQGYKNAAGAGYHAEFADPLEFASLGITAAYTPESKLPGAERTHIDITGRYQFLHGELSWNRPDFYDLFGPTERSRKGFAAKLGYDKVLIYDLPQQLDLLFDVAYFDKIDTLPGAQNVATTFTELATAEVGLHYTDVRRSLGAVDDEKGVTWILDYKESRVPGESSSQFRGGLDLGFALPLRHSSIWLRSAAGIANGDRNSPITSFYFGGFGNNYVDDKSIKRYRDFDSLPGFAIDEVNALNFVREMAEWNLPPYVFESAGTPGFYLTWLRPSLFVAGLWSDPGNAMHRAEHTSAGGQVDLSFSVLHRYNMTLSMGCAAGFDGSRHAGNEWMVSLKIM
jgi:sugar lactone lactonase YvrE